MGSHSRGSCLSLSPSVWDSHTRHCGTGLLRVWMWDIIKFSMGHPCPSLIPVQLESGGVHWTVCLCLYRFYMPQSCGVRWSLVESTRLCAYASIDFTCSSPVGVRWSPLDCVLCLSIDFTCPSLVESTGLCKDRADEPRVVGSGR